MINRFFKIIVVTLFLIPEIAYAQSSIFINSDTYFAASEEDKWSKSRDLSTLYEYLSFDIKENDVSFVFTGWGRVDLGENSVVFEDKGDTNGDFSEAYVNYKSEFSNLNIRLGKQVVLANLSYEGISGLSIRSDLSKNTRIEVYSGVPEELDEKSSYGDLVSGGRISSGITGILELGVGYLTETDDKNRFRREVSADLWLMPFKMLELYGQTAYNKITDSYSYSQANANIYLTNSMTLSVKYDDTDFEDYFDTSELAIFNLFSYNDRLETTQANLTLDISDNSSIDLDFKEYDFKDAKDAESYGIGYKTGIGAINLKLSYHKTDSKDASEGYFDEYRLYIMYNKDKLSLSCDAVLDYFEKKIYNKDSSTSIIASLGYKVRDALGLSIDFDYSETPEYKENFKTFIRAEYSFSSD